MQKLERIGFQTLNRYYDGKKHQPINMGDILINYMIEDSENKIESQKWSGLDGDIKNTKLKDLLHRSDFITERQESAQWLGANGEVFVALIMIDDEWVVSFFKPTSYKVIKTNVIEMIAEGIGTVETANHTQEQLFLRWSTRDDGRVIRDTFYYEGNSMNVTETFIYPSKVKSVPGKLIRNNSRSMPDWVKAADIIQEMNLLSNDIGTEWENVKTMWQNTGVFGKGKKASTRQQQMENGERSFDDYSNNSKFAQQFQAIISGSSSIQLLVQAIVFLEDRALKYTFQGRDTDSSGTNKHTLQVGIFNQAHGEYTMKKIQQRQNDYMRFFKDVVEVVTGIKAPKTITINNSIFEQGKIAGMEQIAAQTGLYNAQTKAQSAQADKHKSDAEKNDATVKQLNAETEVIKKTPIVIPDENQNNQENDE